MNANCLYQSIDLASQGSMHAPLAEMAMGVKRMVAYSLK